MTEIVRTGDFEKISGQAISQAFRDGLRTTKLEGQSASWVTRSLQKLESGKQKYVNARTIRRANNYQTPRLP